MFGQNWWESKEWIVSSLVDLLAGWVSFLLYVGKSHQISTAAFRHQGVGESSCAGSMRRSTYIRYSTRREQHLSWYRLTSPGNEDIPDTVTVFLEGGIVERRGVGLSYCIPKLTNLAPDFKYPSQVKPLVHSTKSRQKSQRTLYILIYILTLARLAAGTYVRCCLPVYAGAWCLLLNSDFWVVVLADGPEILT